MISPKFASIFLLIFIGVSIDVTRGKILTLCEAVAELQRARISRSLISNWICLMQSVSSMNTRSITGPHEAASYNYGVFQINSAKWCARGWSGGRCNKNCDDFANDDISDDIICAKKIFDEEGFKAWNTWQSKCKGKTLPNIGVCRRR